MRKIKLKLLGISGVIYRLHVIIIQSIFFWALTGEWKWAIGTSIVWNVINTFLYYNYHYWFAKLFRIGKDIDTGKVIWLTGLSGSGKSTIAEYLLDYYKNRGHKVMLLDGDIIRNIFPQTGFSEEERNAHVVRVGYVATLLANEGFIVLCSLISPYEESREKVRQMDPGNFVLVHVATKLETCMKRDTKGLYEKAIKGEIKNFTGVSQAYEEPLTPDIRIWTENESVKESAHKIIDYIKEMK